MRLEDIAGKMAEAERFFLQGMSPEAMARQYAEMHGLEKKTLQLVLRAAGCLPFTFQQLEKHKEIGLTGAELKVGLIRLRRQRVLFALRKTWGEQVFIIPSDTFSVWQRLVFASAEGEAAVEERDVEPLHAPVKGLADRLFRLLVYAAEGIPLTQKGAIHRRELLKCAEILELEEDFFQHMEINYAQSAHYSPAFAVVFDFALRLGLLKPEMSSIVLQPSRVGRWLAHSDEQLNLSLYSLWKTVCMPEKVWMQHFLSWMERFPQGQWFQLPSGFDWLRKNRLFPDDGVETALPELVRRALMPLAGLGWLELGKTGEGQYAAQWKVNHQQRGPQPEESAAFFVQPDFEVIVPPSVSYITRWELECLAEHVKTDNVSHYRLSRESVQRAWAHGRDAEDILSFLQQHAQYGVPEHVERAVQSWIGDCGKVRLAEAVLLRCRDEAVAAQIAADEACRPLLAERLGGKDFLIQKQHVRPLTEWLKKNGYAFIEPAGQEKNGEQSPLFPRLQTDAASGEAGALRGEAAANGLIYSPFAVHYYELDKTAPSVAEVYPELEKIPSIWLQDFRTYHDTTRKKMLETAIALQACVKLRGRDGEIRFIPETFAEEGGRWQVHGWLSSRKTCLSPEDWEEMQLILPGINDKNELKPE
jgi:hypothetical protein